MISMLRNWPGSVEINGQKFESISKVPESVLTASSSLNIKLYPRMVQSVTEAVDKTEYKITVRRYMTKKATPEFDFMEKWNHNNPMPYRTMVGEVIKETRGMVYMKLHADIFADRICTCMKCGKTLTNPVSQYFGIGPECGGHNYIHPFDTDEELKEAVEAYKKELQNITWEGWIIRSSIIETVEV